MENILTATNLVKNFGDLQAVKGVSLEIAAGECLALLGPNGAGKTTTVEMLEGLTDPDGGDIRIFGQSLSGQRREIMEDVGVLLQETNLYRKLTVRETLQLFASFFRKAESVDTVIALMGLEEKADARLEELSGGQKQRAYMGCALVNQPRLLFLDEPTTGLLPQARRHIWDLVKSLKSKNQAILLTTHYMEEAEVLADRVMVIDHGQIIASGSPASLIHEHCGEQVIEVAFKSDVETSKIKSAIPWLADADERNHHFHKVSDSPTQHIQEVFRAADSAGIEPSAIEIRKSNLEDVFLKLTGRSIRDA